MSLFLSIFFKHLKKIFENSLKIHAAFKSRKKGNGKENLKKTGKNAFMKTFNVLSFF